MILFIDDQIYEMLKLKLVLDLVGKDHARVTRPNAYHSDLSWGKDWILGDRHPMIFTTESIGRVDSIGPICAICFVPVREVVRLSRRHT